MPKINYITIPEPCNQKWQEMTIVEKGRFCASCQKDVFDFTNSTDREIATALNKNQNLCGRFNVSQLNRELTVPQEKSSVWMIIATSVISLLGLKSNEVYAQESIKIEQTDRKTRIDEKNTIIKKKDSIEISGVIYESNLPLPGAYIHIKESTKGTQTDLNGTYKIKAKQGDILSISFIGFKTEEVKVSSKMQNIKTTLKEETILLGEVGCHRRTFFGRIFHSIGNIFR